MRSAEHFDGQNGRPPGMAAGLRSHTLCVPKRFFVPNNSANRNGAKHCSRRNGIGHLLSVLVCIANRHGGNGWPRLQPCLQAQVRRVGNQVTFFQVQAVAKDRTEGGREAEREPAFDLRVSPEADEDNHGHETAAAASQKWTRIMNGFIQPEAARTMFW